MSPMPAPPFLDEACRTALLVPVYNESAVLRGVLTSAMALFPLVICIDDGSADDSVAVARDAGAIVVEHPVNVGQGAAIQTGIDFALRQTDAAYLVTFDSDGQHQPEDALTMVSMLARDEADVVFGSRFLDERTELSAAKRTVLSLAVRYTNITTGLRLSDAHNGLRAFTRDAAGHIAITRHGMAHASEIVDQVADSGLRVAESPVHIVYSDYSRAKGQSLWNSVNILFDLMLR